MDNVSRRDIAKHLIETVHRSAANATTDLPRKTNAHLEFVILLLCYFYLNFVCLLHRHTKVIHNVLRFPDTKYF